VAAAASRAPGKRRAGHGDGGGRWGAVVVEPRVDIGGPVARVAPAGALDHEAPRLSLQSSADALHARRAREHGLHARAAHAEKTSAARSHASHRPAPSTMKRPACR
jgi:hypothetical protein